MGLDQQAVARRFANSEDVELLQTWRKHPNLQGWMESLWEKKGRPNYDGHNDDNAMSGAFNCVDLPLTLEDIDRLEGDIKAGTLPSTTGFFFGNNADEDYMDEDLEFCSNARKALSEKLEVIYRCWY